MSTRVERVTDDGSPPLIADFVVDLPYREYSAPWFGDRQVLKGGAFATRNRLAYNTYRNFFQPYRTRRLRRLPDLRVVVYTADQMDNASVGSFAAVVVALLLSGSVGAQVPAPPNGKKDTKLPPVLEPARSPIERRDLLQRFQGRHALAGMYRLKQMVVGGGTLVRGSLGYLVIGQRHMSLHLYAPSGSRGLANIQAVFRRFRIVGDTLVMSTLLGHRNKANGDIALEPIGHATQHRFARVGAMLRIYLTNRNYLEFERIE